VAVPELDSEGLASSNRPVRRTVFLLHRCKSRLGLGLGLGLGHQ